MIAKPMDSTPSKQTKPRRKRPGQATRPRRKPTPEAVFKETAQSIVIALILALVFRAYVLEAFVIPTGSMAPSLLGTHLRVRCPQCGHTFCVDTPERHRRTEERYPDGTRQQFITDTVTDANVYATCPMCFYETPLTGQRLDDGDRILVHKLPYTLGQIHRWDVAVFKNPQDINEDLTPGPVRSFIKRVIGLPNESVVIFEGDIYVADLGHAAANPALAYRIARKTDPSANPRWLQIQREAWLPLYDTRYTPLDGGEAHEQRRLAWTQPWQASQGRWSHPQPGRFTVESVQAGLSYQFPTSRRLRALQQFPYNQLFTENQTVHPIEDIRFAVDIQPGENPLTVTLATSARLDHPEGQPQRLTLNWRPDGQVLLRRKPLEPDWPRNEGDAVTLAEAQARPPRAGRTQRLELWLVDHQALVFLDGDLLLRHSFETLSLATRVQRAPAQDQPSIRLHVQGHGTTLHRIMLDRDLYYQSDANYSRASLGQLVVEQQQLRWDQSRPALTGPDEFFCLGDNPPRSSDSRAWNSIDPWVNERYFDRDDPFGIVPRELMVGRAFFVYFPAPFGLWSERPGARPIPNFGDARFIQ